MSHQFPSVGPSGVGALITGTDQIQASSVMERDASSDTNLNKLFAAKGVRSAGHLYSDWQAKAANFTIDESTNNGFHYAVTTSTSVITATLEAASTVPDKIIVISKVDSGTGSVLLDPDASETVGGTTSLALYRQYDMVIIQSNGTNYDILYRSPGLFNQIAASTAVTAASETDFDQYVTIAANTLRAGHRIKFRAQGILTTTTDTDTMIVKLKIGTTVIATLTGADATNNDIFYLEGELVVRTSGASGTAVAAGSGAIGVEATATSEPFKLASFTLDTTAANVFKLTGTWSDTGNSARTDLFTVELF